MADAGYGSEENYAYLEGEGVDAYVKHGEFFRECHNRKWREDEMRVANWEYDEESDEHTCPEGKTLVFLKESSRVSELGYESVVRVYECESCSGCPRKAECSKSASPDAPKRIQANPALNAFRRRASEMLHTEIGSALRKKRSVDVETAFGRPRAVSAGVFSTQQMIPRHLDCLRCPLPRATTASGVCPRR